MLQQLSLDEFLELAKTAKHVAVFKEIVSDRLTPIGIVENLTNELSGGAILESALQQHDAGNYSFITFGLMAQISVKKNIVRQQIGKNVTTFTDHPLIILRQLMTKLSVASVQHTKNFVSGGVGFLTYDAIRLFESIPDRHADENSLPDMLFNFYETTLMFDHRQQKLLINVVIKVDKNPHKSYQKALEKIDKIVQKITLHRFPKKSNSGTQNNKDFDVKVDISDEKFIQLVERAKDYIRIGDAFQIVLSRRFKKRYTANPFAIYRTLRRVSPAPYMFYLPVKDAVIIGASPEKLISIRNRTVTINPIAGTRPRTENSNDQQTTEELLQDKKELAEHRMLVDLARNDIGAVCNPGTVKVTELLQVKHFSHVSHITSTVTGQLQDNKDAFDALAAAFPAGTLSGAPKIRAMEIIDELETSKRSLYGGAICRFDYFGNLDSCIAIRTAILKDGLATVRAGAGIVYDSDPLTEAKETRQKAKAILEAISLAQEGLE